MPVIYFPPRTAGEVAPATAVATFTSQVSVMPWLGIASWPSAEYISGLDKTFVAWEYVTERQFSVARVVAYDHSAGTWGTIYDAGGWDFPDDAHGQPVIHQMPNDYFLCLFGSHDSDQFYTISSSADDVSEWEARQTLSADYTYPKPVNIGSDVHCLWRKTISASTKRPIVHRSGTPSGSTLTFGSETTLVDLGTDTRCYISEVHLRNSDELHFIMARSDYNDTIRQDLYYFVYDTTTGAVSNYSGGTSVSSGSLPVDLSTADASFRLIDSSTDGVSLGSLQFDTNGYPHIIFAQDSPGSGAYDLYHMVDTGGGWSTPAVIGAVPKAGTGNGFVEVAALVPGSAGTMQAWWPKDTGTSYSRGGEEMVRRVWNGAWGTEYTIATDGNSRPLAHPSSVRAADGGLRVMFTELSDGSADDYDNKTAVSLFMYGDSGPVAGPSPEVTQYEAGDDVLHLRVNTAGDEIIDAAWNFEFTKDINGVSIVSGPGMYFNGNDWIEIDDSFIWELPGDFTITFEQVTFDSTSGVITLFGKQDEGAGNRDWRVIYTGGAIYFQADLGGGFGTVVSYTWAPSIGTPYDLAFERDGNTIYIYVDDLTSGNHVASAAMTSGPTDTTFRVTVGASYSTFESFNHYRYFDGQMEKLRVNLSAEIRG